MRPPLILRRAGPEDAGPLTDLIFRSKQSNGYDSAFMEACREELRVHPGDLIRRHVLVAARDGVLLGCVALDQHKDPGTGEVGLFFVEPSAKRQGIGGALWQELLTIAQRNGLSRLTLEADPEAVAFYEAMGFATIGRAPSGSIPGRFLPLMARDI